MSVKTLECDDSFTIGEEILGSFQPIVLRGLVEHWPIVEAAKKSNIEVIHYLNSLYSGVPVTLVSGKDEIQGRVAYSPDLSELNCVSKNVLLPDALRLMMEEAQTNLHYIGTAPTRGLIPEFRRFNNLEFNRSSDQFMWLGNRSCISAHYDLPDNLACNVVGKRRFTIFPPSELKNLYIGPRDYTPAGRPISLVDVRNPDYDRFPLYRGAEKQAVVVELDAGDALFLPTMWWHNVEGVSDLNILVNYWWRNVPAHTPSPEDVLDLAILALRDLPKNEKQAWRDMLDHYVFHYDESNFQYIPESVQGSVGKLSDTIVRQLRAKLLSNLNR